MRETKSKEKKADKREGQFESLEIGFILFILLVSLLPAVLLVNVWCYNDA